MKKADALKMFGGTIATAKACRISKQAVSGWPDELTDKLADRVVAAALRAGKKLPRKLQQTCSRQ